MVRCRLRFAARAATAAAIPALIADLRSTDENNDSSPAHPGSDAAKDTQSIASPEHHVAPPATLQNNHVGSQENTEAAHQNLEPSAWTPDPGAVPHPLSCYAATQPSTDAHEVCHSGRNVKIDGIFYRADQGIQAPPLSPRRPYRVPTPPAAPDRRQRPAPSFHLPDQVRKIASRIQPATSPPAHPGLDRAQAARPTARPTARLQHAQNPQPRDIAGSGQTFFGPSIRPPRTSDTSRGSNTAASSHERQPQLQAPRSDKELAKLERVQRPPQDDFLPFSEIYEHQKPKQHAVELAAVAQLTQTLLDMAVNSDIDPDMVREFAHQVLASGTPEACDELSATMTPISDGVHNMLYVPWKGQPLGTLRSDPPRDVYSYVCARGTDVPTAGKIMLEDVCRLSSIKHLIGGTNKEIPGCVVYGSATPGAINKHTIHTVVDQATRRAKGQQGVLVIGTVQSIYQHYKIEYRDMYREAFIVSRKGVVRTPDKWGWHTGHFSIAGFGLIC